MMYHREVYLQLISANEGFAFPLCDTCKPLYGGSSAYPNCKCIVEASFCDSGVYYIKNIEAGKYLVYDSVGQSIALSSTIPSDVVNAQWYVKPVSIETIATSKQLSFALYPVKSTPNTKYYTGGGKAIICDIMDSSYYSSCETLYPDWIRYL
jgi:hypothetical protein